jgi:AcrR family transcriptional regulator
MAGERRGRPPAADSAKTRGRVVLAAQLLFAERGYHGVSMDQIAAEAGVNVRAIYHYVPSKRALFEAAAAATFEQYGSEVAGRVLGHDDLAARLHGFVDVYRSLYQHHRHVLAFLSIMLIEAIVDARSTKGDTAKGSTADDPAYAYAEPIIAMNRVLVEQARDRGELAGTVSADAAIALLQTIGMGLGLAAMDDDTAFLPMLDALDLLIDGLLVLPRPDAP